MFFKVLCFRTFIKGRILEHLSSYENGQHSNLDSAIETTCDMLVELIALFPEDETFRIRTLDKNIHTHHPGNPLDMYWKRIKPS